MLTTLCRTTGTHKVSIDFTRPRIDPNGNLCTLGVVLELTQLPSALSAYASVSTDDGGPSHARRSGSSTSHASPRSWLHGLGRYASHFTSTEAATTTVASAPLPVAPSGVELPSWVPSQALGGWQPFSRRLADAFSAAPPPPLSSPSLFSAHPSSPLPSSSSSSLFALPRVSVSTSSSSYATAATPSVMLPERAGLAGGGDAIGGSGVGSSGGAGGDASSAGGGARRLLAMGGMSELERDELLWEYRTLLSAGSASLVSTAASFPFDSLKSRLQVKYYPSIWACGKAVLKEEGLGGFFRGVTIPLITISFVRTSSFSIYVTTKDALHARGKLADKDRLWDTALSGVAGGMTSGIIISCGSAPFELVKVQRQLEYLTAVQRGLVVSQSVGSASAGGTRRTAGLYRPKTGFEAAADIWRHHGGPRGFYIGFPLHICRDTMGTAFYFGFYDTIRALVNRQAAAAAAAADGASAQGSPLSSAGGTSGGNGGPPAIFGLPGPLVSFLSGSTAGIASWLLVYPVDLLKTNVQQRALSRHPQQLTGWQLFLQLMQQRSSNVSASSTFGSSSSSSSSSSSTGGPAAADAAQTGSRVAPPPHEVSVLRRFLRLYRGLGVSAVRSFISHGLTWAIIEQVQAHLGERRGSHYPGGTLAGLNGTQRLV